MAINTQIGMPLDNDIRQYEDRGPFELLDGARLVMW